MRKSVHNTRVTVPRKAVLQELMLADFENVPLLSLEDHQLLHMMPVGDGASETRSAPEYVKLMQNVIIPWVKQDMPKENTIEAVKRELMKQCHELAWVNPEKVSIVTQRETLSRLIAFCSCCGTCDGEEWQRHMVKFRGLQKNPTIHIHRETSVDRKKQALILTSRYGAWNGGSFTPGPTFKRLMTSGSNQSIQWFGTNSFSLGNLHLIVRSEIDAVDDAGDIVQLKIRRTSYKRRFNKRPFNLESFLAGQGLLAGQRVTLYLQMLLGGAKLFVLGLHRIIARDKSRLQNVLELNVDKVPAKLSDRIVVGTLLGRTARILRAISEVCDASPQQQCFRVEMDVSTKTITILTDV